MESKGFNKRKILLINPKFQTKIIMQFFILMGVIFATVMFLVIWQYVPLIDEVQTVGLDSSHPIMLAFEKFQFMSVVIIICTTIFCACMFYIAALVVSNKIAGPLYHLCKHLKGLRESDEEYRHLTFRKNDYFPEVADEINRFIDSVEKKK